MAASCPAFSDQLAGDDWSVFNSADVIVFGEVHDNPHHHANQARAVAALKPAALVFEQLTPDLARRVMPELVSDAVALEEALEWEKRGWPDFAMYYPIMAAVPEAALFGGGLPRDDVRRAIGEGAAAVFGGGAGVFGIDSAYSDQVQANLEALQQEAHCNALPPEMLPGMVEAQRLRDAGLARATLAAVFEARARAEGAKVVVITGNGHAANALAIPSMLKLADPDLSVVSVGQFETEAPDAPDFDFWLVTKAAEREDPCATFR